jgi:hypothetical protein
MTPSMNVLSRALSLGSGAESRFPKPALARSATPSRPCLDYSRQTAQAGRREVRLSAQPQPVLGAFGALAASQLGPARQLPLERQAAPADRVF